VGHRTDDLPRRRQRHAALGSVPANTRMQPSALLWRRAPRLMRRRSAVENESLHLVNTSCILCKAMHDIRFEWDPVKAKANLRKHGVAFEEAETVFSDDAALLIDDPDHSEDEVRFVLLGFSAAPRILVVVHAYRSTPATIRIISARKATKAERAIYVKRPRP
jgi:uncharacterized DUF497 family protein